MYVIDEKERKIIITNERTRNVIEIKENEELKRIFLEGTEDKYRCFLKLMEVDVIDENTHEPTGEKITKAFAVRENEPSWLMEFSEEEYILE